MLLASTGNACWSTSFTTSKESGKNESNSGYGENYKITVHENDEEEHVTYCTPESVKTIDHYMDMRRRYDERIYPNSLLIRDQFDIKDPFVISKPRAIKPISLSNKIRDIAIRAGLRIVEEFNKTEKHPAL